MRTKISLLGVCLASICMLGCQQDAPPKWEPLEGGDPFADQPHPFIAKQANPPSRGSVISSAARAPVSNQGGGGGGGALNDLMPPRGYELDEDDVQRAAEGFVNTNSRDIQDDSACEQAFTALESFSNDFRDVPGRRTTRRPRRERFMEACRNMPAEMQRCLVPDYYLSNKEECDETRAQPIGAPPGRGGNDLAEAYEGPRAGASSAKNVNPEPLPRR